MPASNTFQASAYPKGTSVLVSFGADMPVRPGWDRAGWLDAGTVAGTLTRFATFSNPQEVEIGRWNHARATICDPLLPAGEAASCFRRYGPEGPDDAEAETFTVELGERSHLDLPVLPAT
jgi:hypothetical protein